MDEPRTPPPLLAPALPAPPDALVLDTWILDPPAPHERPNVLRPEAAALVDGLLTRVARGEGALDVAIGEVLAELALGDRLLHLGWSCFEDYARERLDLGETAARDLVRLSRALRDRPILREAVRRGEVSARKAQAILKVAVGEAEAVWVERARSDTVRALESAARATLRCGSAETKPDPWERARIEMTEEEREKLDRAMDLAGRVLGSGAPRWQRLEAICEEYLGAFTSEPRDDDVADPQVLCGPVADWLDSAREGLEQEMRRWEFLEPVPTVPAPVDGLDAERAGGVESALLRLDSRLRELAAMRARWSVLLGHLAMLMKNVGLWRDAGFASFSHYSEERLGLATRTIEQRAALARRCYRVPGVREAMREGRLPYEKARLVARVADEHTVGDWLRRAERATVIELRREVEAQEQTQMCERGELELRVPRTVRILVDAVVRAVRERGSGFERAGECLARAAEHFIEVWGHHLHGVHLGWVRVRGTAPDALVWEMRAPPGAWRA